MQQRSVQQTKCQIKTVRVSLSSAGVKSWDGLSALLARSLLSGRAATLSTAGCREEQSGRFMRRSLTHPQLYSLQNPPTLSRISEIFFGFAKTRRTCPHPCPDVYVLTRAAGTKDTEAEALRLVLRKVLRNWQVDCAMHAWAKPLGERSTDDLAILTLLPTPSQRLSPVSLIYRHYTRWCKHKREGRHSNATFPTPHRWDNGCL